MTEDVFKSIVQMLKPIAQHVVDTMSPQELMMKPRLLEWCGRLNVYKDMK